MQLTGFTLAQVLTTLAAAGAITVALYLLRTRRRRVQVPYIQLWETLLRDRRSSRLFQSLRHLLSLLLALLIVALLSLALGDPRQSHDSPDVEHVVVLVDAGATMQATDVQPSRLHAALEEARAIVASAGPRRRMLVAQVDASTTPLSPMTGDGRALQEALEAVRASDTGSDHGRALEFAAAVLTGRSEASVVLLSDRAEPLPERAAEAVAAAGAALRFVPIGRRGDNVAISAFALRRYPLDKNRSELLVELHNGSEHAERVELTLSSDGQPVDVQTVEVAAGKRLRRIYDDVTGVASGLQASIRVLGDDHDDLALDDRAFAVVPERRAARVLCVTEGNLYLEAALLLDEYLQVEVLAPAQYRGAEGYDVVIFDGHQPERPPGVPALYLDAGASEAGALPVAVGEALERPFFESLKRRHRLLRFTALADVNVARARALQPAAGDVAVAADRRGALIVAGEREGTRFVAFGFDVRDTDLPLRVAWPLLLLNVIDWFTVQESELRSTYAVGETATLQVPQGIARVVHHTPAGEQRTLGAREGRVSVAPERVGLHRLSWDGGERLFAASLEGSTLRPLAPAASMQAAGRPVPPPEARPATDAEPPWVLLALAVFALLVVEWFTFHRRWTV